MSGVDLELRKQFQELQIQVIDSKNKMRQLDAQVELLRRSSQHGKLTQTEISALLDDTNVYEGIGRMFVKRNQAEIKENLTQKLEKNEEKIKALESSKNYIESTLKEKENNLRDLVAQKQRQMQMSTDHPD